MARFATKIGVILGTLGRVMARDQKSIWSLASNNFFIVSVFVLQGAGGFLYLIIGLVILFPLSTDPLRKIPASRLNLWPLDGRERRVLRAVSPWVNPMTWAMAALAVWAMRGKVTAGLWALSTGLVASGFVLSSLPMPSGNAIFRHVPHFPGPLNQLLRRNLRAMLSTLDLYCGLLLSLAMIVFRLTRQTVPPEALPIITVLVVVSLSSYAQCLFGLDGKGGLSRYRLLPLPGWQVLAAKDAVFLLVTILLTLPLAPLTGFGAGAIALAIGHRSSVYEPRTQERWRFSTGSPPVVKGLVQVAAMAVAAAAIFHYSALFVLPCIAVWAGSLWWYGRAFERMA